jgi:hypothetical protein
VPEKAPIRGERYKDEEEEIGRASGRERG